MKPFEASVFVDKAKIKKIYVIGGILFLAAVGAVVWSYIFWDDFSEVVTTITGKTRVRGLAPTLNGWGWGFAIAIPIVYGLMFLSLDFKNPSLGVNADGLFINQQLFKRVLIKWEEMASVGESAKGLQIFLKDPAAVIARSSGMSKPFLKQTYITQGSPITLDKSAFKGEFEKMEGLIKQYFKANQEKG